MQTPTVHLSHLRPTSKYKYTLYGKNSGSIENIKRLFYTKGGIYTQLPSKTSSCNWNYARKSQTNLLCSGKKGLIKSRPSQNFKLY